jgi:hypothetical protein
MAHATGREEPWDWRLQNQDVELNALNRATE